MIRRPKATDTEEDLLAFQEKFFSSGEKPSASVKTEQERKIRVGSKRSEQGALSANNSEYGTQERDVVNLQVESGDVAKPPAKRSKFKERRSKTKEMDTKQDHHKFMESQDKHITTILSEIHERESTKSPGFKMMSSRYTRRGFPTTQTLEPTSVAMETSSSSEKSHDKKSLFAQQFESHNLEYFGVETPSGVTGSLREDSFDVHSVRVSGASVDQGLSSDRRGDRRVSESNLISGEGLMAVGVSREVAKDEMTKIHEENAQRLLSLSEEEILTEREKLQQLLDPKVISFVKSRRHQSIPDDQSRRPPKSSTISTLGPPSGPPSEPSIAPPSSSLTTPPTWVHMDVVERDKMEWMTDVDIHRSEGAAPARYETNEVRFSLDGQVIPRDVILPAHLGLHHHGNEPQSAGYTLDELLSLCRSTVLQQRTLSLQVLAKIIQRARINEFAQVVDGRVLDDLLAAGLPLLLRYTLDENVGSVMFAAVTCLYSLLVIPLEDSVLDEYSLCHLGCVLPSLRSHDRSHDLQTKEERESETDAEILQHDIVQGYLEMKLLHRIRYILEVCSPPTPLPTHLLHILTRVARHSVYAATQVMSCPRLIEVVFRQFLPFDWSTANEGVVDGKANLSAMKLIYALCSAGRNIASQLVAHHNLMSVITRYSIPHPSEFSLPAEQAYGLATTALLTWAVLLSYGIGSETLRDTFPEILKQLQSLSASVMNDSSLERRRAGGLLRLIEAAVHVAAVTEEQLRIEGTGDTHPSPAIEWSHARGLYTPLVNCLVSISQQTSTSTGTLTDDGSLCAGNLLHCLASYYSQPKVSPVDSSEGLASLFERPIAILSGSPLFSLAVETLRDLSTLATPLQEIIPPPPSLLTHLLLTHPPKPALYNRPPLQTDDNKFVQSRVASFTAANLIWGYVRLCRASLQFNKSIANKMTALFKNSVYWEYLGKVAHAVGSKVSTFDLVEVSLLYDSVKLLHSLMELTGSVHEGCGQLTFDLTYKLLKLLPPGMERLVWDLLSTLALHPDLISTQTSSLLLEKVVTSLSLSDPPQPITFESISKVSSTMTTSDLVTVSLGNLSSILSVYQLSLRSLCSERKISRSEAIINSHPFQTPSLLFPPCHAHVLPEDWILLPIIQEYNRSVSVQRNADIADDSIKVVTIVTRSLQLLLLLEHLHPHLLEELPVSAKLTRLMCVYLIDSELFLEKLVHACLSSLLAVCCRESTQKSLDFTTPIPGLSSFVDLYSVLLDQFAAVSYGDRLFACYVILPLQQRFTAHLRKLVWGEHPAVIRLLSLPLNQVPLPLENFLHPLETDTQLIEMYMAALAAETVRSLWSPLFYLIAVHHTHHFIFEDQENDFTSLRKELLLRVFNLSSQHTKCHVLLYGGVNLDSHLGFKLNKQLGDAQKAVITLLLGTSVADHSLSLSITS